MGIKVVTKSPTKWPIMMRSWYSNCLSHHHFSYKINSWSTLWTSSNPSTTITTSSSNSKSSTALSLMPLAPTPASRSPNNCWKPFTISPKIQVYHPIPSLGHSSSPRISPWKSTWRSLAVCLLRCCCNSWSRLVGHSIHTVRLSPRGSTTFLILGWATTTSDWFCSALSNGEKSIRRTRTINPRNSGWHMNSWLARMLFFRNTSFSFQVKTSLSIQVKLYLQLLQTISRKHNPRLQRSIRGLSRTISRLASRKLRVL